LHKIFIQKVQTILPHLFDKFQVLLLFNGLIRLLKQKLKKKPIVYMIL